MSKILIIIWISIALLVGAYIIALNVKLSMAETRNSELKAKIAGKDVQIAKVEAAIRGQNEWVARISLERESAEALLKTENERLNKKYELAKKKAAALGASPGCAEQLKSIYEAQEAWCYER